MCWRCNSEPIRMVAERDIPVQKVLNKSIGVFMSCLFPYQWKLGKVEECEIGDVRYNGCIDRYVIDDGFHSCKGIHRYGQAFYNSNKYHLFFSSNPNEVVFDAVIPAGSEYYLNEHGDYVSNRLKIIGEAKVLKKS